MAGERKLTVVLAGDSRGLERTLGNVDRVTSNLGGKLASFGKAAALGLGGAALAVGAGAKSAISAGSDLNETISKSNTVFGDAASAIDQWSRTAASSFGQSRKQALEAASNFGNMFSQLGIGDQQAADMSKSMTELASDFASFHNADISEVLEAQSAAFRGEYDSVQKFVPTINAAAVEQKALAMGLGETTKDLDAQDKALATQALLLEGAGDAAGDFARTSDGLANKQRIMSARFEDVKAKIGQGLIPVALKLAGFFSDKVLPAFEKVGGGIVAFVGAFQNAEDGITSGGFAGWMEKLAITAREVFDQISATVREWVPKIVAAFQQVVGFVQQHWPEIQRIISQVTETVKSVVSGAVSVVTTLWQNFGNNILEFVQRVWPRVQQVIEGVMNIIQGVIKTITSLIKGDWSAVWEGIKQTFSGVWEAIQGIVGTALEALRTVIGAGLEIIGSVVKSAWEGILNFLKELPGKIRDAASGMWDGLKSAFKGVINWIIRAWNGLEFKIPGFDPPGPGPKFGGFTLGVPDIPTLHTGGVFDSGRGEGLALLKDGEGVFTPEQMRMLGKGQSSTYSYTIQVPAGSEHVADRIVRELHRDAMLAAY